jgi:hypothetical protein
MFDIKRSEVPARAWSALRLFLSAPPQGVALAKLPGIGQKTADWLLAEGLLEKVNDPKFNNLGACYRITEFGQKVARRGQKATSARETA